MTKGKGQSSDPPHAVREMWRWTEEMDFVMLTAFTEEQNNGHRHHIKNRMKNATRSLLRRMTCSTVYLALPGIKSQGSLEAEEEVWEDFIRDKPQAAKWKTMQIRHYNLLKGLFGTDRAARRKTTTGRQAHSSLDKETIDLNDVGEDTSMNDQGGTQG
ncbi:hypothetical protein SESBI_35432 [Sesbania bispinosa]|nr:hypothetical protein SESBI_35432 [Sesbania bispinosa]